MHYMKRGRCGSPDMYRLKRRTSCGPAADRVFCIADNAPATLEHHTSVSCLICYDFRPLELLMLLTACPCGVGVEGMASPLVGGRTAAASVQQQPSRGAHMPQQGSAGVAVATARHVHHRANSQAQQDVTRGLLSVDAEGNSPAVGGDRMRLQQGAGRKSVQFAPSEMLSGGKDVNGKRHHELDEEGLGQAATQAPATRGQVPVSPPGLAGSSGAASAPSGSAHKVSGSKLQAKRAKSRPSFVEGF